MDVSEKKRSRPDCQSKAVVGAFTLVFLLIAIMFCVGGIGALRIRELQDRIESLEKVCGTNEGNSIYRREVLSLSSSSKQDIQALLVTQLQDRISNVQGQCKVGDSNLKREITDQAAELRKEMESESLHVQQQFDDIRLQINKEFGTVDKGIERVNNRIALHHPNYTGITCATGYKLNPYRGTCTRFVKTALSWSDARATCENAGEYLATFDTVEAASWVRHQQLTAGWGGDVWIGSKKLSNSRVYRWYGINTGPITLGYWAVEEPNYPGTEHCVATLRAYYWGDHDCQEKLYFICEKNAK